LLVSEKLGALPWLSFVWDHGPVGAFIIVLLFDFGMICFLMSLEGLPVWKRRPLYKTFFWGDLIFIPLHAAGVVICMESAPVAYHFYLEPWWQWSLLGLGATADFVMEFTAVKGDQYTWAQELSPAKLWHTLIYPVMVYWVLSGLAAVVMMPAAPPLGVALVTIGIGGWLAMNGFDWANGRKGLRLEKFALEGTYIPWKWHVRKK